MESESKARPSDGWLPTGGPAKKPKLLPLKSINIVSKQSRQKAKPSTFSKYERIRKGLSVGWRMNTDRQGSWTARRMTPDGYQFGVIGHSDEQAPADGVAVFDYDQAVAACIEWDRKAATNTQNGPYSVSQAADDWLAAWTGSESSKATATNNVEHWIKPMLGSIPVVNLTTPQLQRWLESVANSPGKNNTKNYDPNDPETRRKRRDTANRIFNDVAAILNRAFKMRPEITSDAAWRKVEKFSNVAKAMETFLTADEVQKLLNACEKDFRALTYAAIVTGCRYNEIATMTVANYNAANQSISLVQPKTQKIKHVFLNESEAQFFDALVKDKLPTDRVFLKADGNEWVKDDQRYRIKNALKAAGIKRPFRYHDCRHTAASLLAAGKVDLAYISKHLGHSSQRVTERYRHLVESHLAETIRAAKPVFSTSPNNGKAATS
jgi:integrase